MPSTLVWLDVVMSMLAGHNFAEYFRLQVGGLTVPHGCYKHLRDEATDGLTSR
jgi:hypothetical protein